jgi:hypothetical protein
MSIPILMIGNDFDPATPLSWTRSLAYTLGMERSLLRYQGGGHGAYLTRGIGCIDSLVEAYVFDRIVPPEGTQCSARPISFDP